MERNSFRNSLKDHRVVDNAIKDDCSSSSNNNNNISKLNKDSWSGNNLGFGEDYYLAGFSWPPRSYTCSFCQKEFRSAQALGGHMNVHRRDRARLRQSPPRGHGLPPFLNLNHNPNPNLSSSSSVSSHDSSTLPSLLVPPSFSSLSSQSSAFPSETKKWRANGTLIDPLSQNGTGSIDMKRTKSFFGAKEFKDYNGYHNKFPKKKKTDDYVTSDLEIGLVSDSKEDLDLELRLGYS
ncbi:hypothetical protein PTKIN_Ptkin09bG0048500 [Pterospermum kingtungense]